ncbi:MAG: hypothetical protein EWV68_06695, partial [Microcystis sp. M_QC_C_20170808_M9Col]
LRLFPIVFDLERANQLSLLPDKDLVDLCPLIESYQVTKSRKSRVSVIDYARMLRPYRDLMGRLSELYHRDNRRRLLVYCPG